jgi:nitrogen-specific signal transduction histidine kinase
LPPIEGDAGQLHQLVMNLVINGAEAIGADQSGTLLVTTGVQDVDDAYLKTTFSTIEIQPGKYVTLEVHDTGCTWTKTRFSEFLTRFLQPNSPDGGLGWPPFRGSCEDTGVR